jgi:hypothetical protein
MLVIEADAGVSSFWRSRREIADTVVDVMAEALATKVSQIRDSAERGTTREKNRQSLSGLMFAMRLLYPALLVNCCYTAYSAPPIKLRDAVIAGANTGMKIIFLISIISGARSKRSLYRLAESIPQVTRNMCAPHHTGIYLALT